MSISVSIMAHPARMIQVANLLEQLDAPASVAWDMDSPPGRDPERIWRVASTAWRMYDGSADWHLLLQDDAIVGQNLIETLTAAVEHVPRQCVVSPYIGSGRPLSLFWSRAVVDADRSNASWIVGPRPFWGVALMLPTKMIDDMIAYGDRQHGVPDDMRVAKWAQRARLDTWYTWPCLVDHPEDSSIIGNDAGRVARRFSRDVSKLSWDGPAIRWKRR